MTKVRINVLRTLGILLVPPAIFIHPAYGESILGKTSETAGMLLIGVFVMGRCWSLLYVGQRKNRALVTTGPYSLCRNPLYLFSMIGVLGFGMMLQSLVYAVFLTLATFLVYYWNIRQEEKSLLIRFPEEFKAYVRSTPRILPTLFATLNSEPRITIDVKVLEICFREYLLALFLILIATAVQHTRIELAEYSFIMLW